MTGWDDLTRTRTTVINGGSSSLVGMVYTYLVPFGPPVPPCPPFFPINSVPEMRNSNRTSKFNEDFKIDKSKGNFKFNGQPTIIKAYDLDNGEEISGFKRLTNLDNN